MKAHLCLCLLAAGCVADSSSGPPNEPPPAGMTEPPAPTPVDNTVPGIVVDGAASAVSALTRQTARPCGYDHQELDTFTGSADQMNHSTATITYNAAGLDVLEDEIDDTGASKYRFSSDYNERGDTTHWLSLQQDYKQEAFLMYDASGRLTSYETDTTSPDASHTSTYTFKYGANGLRATAHYVRTDRPERSYDRTYTYDEQNRVIRIDRDFKFDGTIDESDHYTYNDAGLTATLDTVDGTGALISHTDYSFDAFQHLTKEATHSVDPTDIQDFTYDHIYDQELLVGDHQRYRDASPDNTFVSDTMENYRYLYSCK